MSSSRRATILIVDDDPTVTATFAQMLNLKGYRAHTALNAEAGLHKADACQPDAIILDLRMPLVDGLGFLRRLRARDQHRTTPVAIVTGDYTVDNIMIGTLRDLGATIHFKPLWFEDLVDLARKLVPE